MKTIKVTGILKYSPKRYDFKKSHKTDVLILELYRDDLCAYYQWMLEKKYGQCMKLQSPMYGAHVTVVKAEESKKAGDLWGKYQNKKITVEYSPKLENHWRFWTLPVYSKELEEIRTEMGLKKFPFHITIGRQEDWVI